MLNNRKVVAWMISVPCFCAFLAGQMCFGQTDEWKSERKAVVLDANQAPVIGAKVYRRTSFIWDAQKSGVYLSENTKVLYETDANGEFFFELPQRGAGVLFLIVDENLSKIGHLRVQRKDKNNIHTVIVSAPAHINAILESKQVLVSNLFIDIGFFERQKRAIHGSFITVDYNFDEDVNSIPLDIMCPSGSHLKFTAQTQESLKDIEKDIPPLVPGEVFDMGRITMEPAYGYTLIGKKPPKLEVAEWIKGEATTLEALKGRVVLLDFWGLWCPPCRKKFPELERFHKKYARDGLVIISIHDSSLEKESLIKQGQRAINLSDVRFRVAIDSPTSEPSGTQVQGAGKGKTIEAYGVSRFPTTVLVAPDGKVHSFGGGDLEASINVLLYGHTKNLNRELSFQQELLLLARKEFLLAGIGIAGLLLVGIYCALRSRTKKQTKQV